MVVDILVVVVLNRWEKRMKAQRELNAQESAKAHETAKKETRAQKAASRKQQRAEDKKNHQNGSAGTTSFAPRQHIQQPDKSKKLR